MYTGCKRDWMQLILLRVPYVYVSVCLCVYVYVYVLVSMSTPEPGHTHSIGSWTRLGCMSHTIYSLV
jgi:hypothetical protein